MRFYNRLLAILCRLALCGQTVKKTCVYLCPNLSSTKVNASRWPNKTQVELKSKICVNLRVRLARPLSKRGITSKLATELHQSMSCFKGMGVHRSLQLIWRNKDFRYLGYKVDMQEEWQWTIFCIQLMWIFFLLTKSIWCPDLANILGRTINKMKSRKS